MYKRIQTLLAVTVLAVSMISFMGYAATSNLYTAPVDIDTTIADNSRESSFFAVSTLLPVSGVQAQGDSDSGADSSSNGNGGCEKLGVPILDDSEVCPDDTPGGNIIYSYIALVIKFLSIGVGLVITLMIAVSGVQYMMARDDPKKIEAAKHKIWNAVLALILFILMYALINFIVPGGVF